MKQLLRRDNLVPVALVILTMFIGSACTDIGLWYQGLQKPWFQPPNWVFGPVWTVLYIMIAWAGVIVWNAKSTKLVTLVKTVYLLQLALNAAWSFLFFSLHAPLLAFADLVLLWVTIILFMMMTIKTKTAKATWLFLPYFFWVSFAGVLNGFIVSQINLLAD